MRKPAPKDNRSALLHIMRSPAMQSVLTGAAAGILAIMLGHLQLLGWLDHRIGDWRIRQLAAPAKGTDQVATIIVDQNSLSEAQDLFGISWPWPREIYSYILSFCQRAGVKAIAFDLVYTESSTHGVEDDARFAAALSNAPPALLALTLGKQASKAMQWPNNLQQPIHIQQQPASIWPSWQTTSATFPIPVLRNAAQGLGNVLAKPDSDAVFRNIAPFALFDEQLIPALGIGTYLIGNSTTSVFVSKHEIKLGNQAIPLSPTGHTRLRYRGPSQTHQAFNATAILQSELQIAEGSTPAIDPESLRDKYILFGLTAPGLMDLKPTPVGKTYPGVEVHATLLDNLISNDFYADIASTWVSIIAIVFAILGALSIRKIQKVTISALAFPIFIIAPIALAFALDPLNVWFPAGSSITASTLSLLGALLLNYATEGRQKRYIKGAFKQYISPEVIERLLDDPSKLQLGGEERNLSIFFSDIQGFTTISEKLTPTKLTKLLNEYLTAMTDIILAAGGTIDKYEGDAIIAFWNAPLAQKDHATRAVQAAMDCQNKLQDMQADIRARYGCEVHARIGINTGMVVVGNMGSNQRFDYTFLGDAGNLASRLEGINKQFGTSVLISQYTREQLSANMPLREIATVRVVGKNEPVTIFEPFTQPSCEATAFDQAIKHFQNKEFQDAKEIFTELSPKDPVSKQYLFWCEQYAGLDTTNWDGIIQLKEK